MVFKESFKLQSNHRAVSFHDITDQVKDICKKSGLKDGIVVVYSHHTTCSRHHPGVCFRHVHDRS